MGPLSLLKKSINGALRPAGIKLIRRSVVSDTELQLLMGLSLHEVSVVIDVGANKGQFALSLFKSGYGGEIVSIEPLSKAHEALTLAARRNRKWFVAERCVLGETCGETSINVSANSVSSSILPMLRSHSDVATNSIYTGKERVQMRTLDSVASGYIEDGKNIFLKIDTQGYEWQVLEGAESVLSRTIGVQCELSLMPLYDGQKLWLELSEKLEALGFGLWAVQPGFSNSQTGRLLQMDGIFFRTAKPQNK